MAQYLDTVGPQASTFRIDRRPPLPPPRPDTRPRGVLMAARDQETPRRGGGGVQGLWIRPRGPRDSRPPDAPRPRVWGVGGGACMTATPYRVSCSFASRYLANVASTMCGGSSGPGGCLFHLPAATSVSRYSRRYCLSKLFWARPGS